MGAFVQLDACTLMIMGGRSVTKDEYIETVGYSNAGGVPCLHEEKWKQDFA